MKSLLWTLLLLAGIAASASAADIAGSWRVDYVSGVAMQTIGSAEFEFEVEGNQLTGTAHIGVGWPGTAPVTEGSIDGNRISFLVVGQSPSSDGYPKMRFTGTVQSNKIQLTLILFYSDERGAKSFQSEYGGKRITN